MASEKCPACGGLVVRDTAKLCVDCGHRPDIADAEKLTLKWAARVVRTEIMEFFRVKKIETSADWEHMARWCANTILAGPRRRGRARK